MEQLVRAGLVRKATASKPYEYSLTKKGFQYCFHLFNEKYHPSQGDFVLIKPGKCRVLSDGTVLPLDHSAGGGSAIKRSRQELSPCKLKVQMFLYLYGFYDCRCIYS